MALMLAQEIPHSGLVLLASGPPAGIFPIRSSNLLPGMFCLRKWAFWRKSLELPYWAAKSLLFNRFTPKEARKWYLRLVPDSGKVFREVVFNFLDATPKNRVDWNRLNAPCWIGVGTKDRICPPSYSRFINQNHQQSTLVHFSNAGHLLFHEPGAEKVWEELDQWLLTYSAFSGGKR